MKVEIDVDTLLGILSRGPAEHVRGDNEYLNNYADGRAAATLHIATMLGVELLFDVDHETFRRFTHILDPAFGEGKVAAPLEKAA